MLATLLSRLKARIAHSIRRRENSYWRQLSDAEIARGAHRDFVGGMWDEIGRLQFDFMLAQGLRPEHRLLDVGCGALRGGLHFVRYLEPGHYFGVDGNASLVRAGRHELAASGLTKRAPNLMVNDRFEFWKFDVQFDFLMAISLMTHLNMNHIVRCLGEAHRVLPLGGKFYASFFEAPHPAHLATIAHTPGGVITHLDSDPYHYSFDELETAARYVGMEAERIGDWRHPRAQQMMYFTKVRE